MLKSENSELKCWQTAAIILAVCTGIFFRLYRITQNEFFFYDEGLYLNLHLGYLQKIAAHPPKTLHDFLAALYLCFRLSLGEGKALWFFISHLRVFWGGLEDWYFPRLISAMAGILTLPSVFILAKNFSKSKQIAWLSLVLLTVLPSHVFYSRLALQEGLCTFLFLWGFYFYFFPFKFGLRTFFSSVVLGMTFFLNYRLIVLPVLVLFCELYLSFSARQKPDFRKYLWHTLTFFSLVFLIGNIDQAQNTVVTFAWMLHQAQLSTATYFDFFNLFSYPYYFFRLENVLWGIFFFCNLYFIIKKDWRNSFFFCFVCFYMIIFSFPQDKAARYVCVLQPFAAIAVSIFVIDFSKKLSTTWIKKVFFLCVFLTVIFLTSKSAKIAHFKSDYASSVEYLKGIDKNPRILTTQMFIQNLYSDKVFQCPSDMSLFIVLYHQYGFRYLIVDPQAYISWTQSGKKFNPPLNNYLQFIVTQLKPIKIFPHFNDDMLERFVFEHNENLRQSLAFLNVRSQHFGTLRIYDMKDFINILLWNTVNKRNNK